MVVVKDLTLLSILFSKQFIQVESRFENFWVAKSEELFFVLADFQTDKH